VVVRQVLDGDSLVLADGRELRLIGINAPEFGKDGRPDEPLARAARERLQVLVEGREANLALEEEQRDRYGRWLVHLRLADGRSVEEILLREGLACAIAIPPNLNELARHQAAAAEARRARRGLWGHAYFAARPAERLAPADTGFRFVQGRVTHSGQSRKFVYLDLGPQVALRIGRRDWERYFHGQPSDWRGVRLAARGWINEYQGRLHLSIGHPAMIERLP
jgi:endonuclease YncB( thermonuclease family)